MANEEQLSILKQGVEVWNKWRRANPDVSVDLTDANLHSAELPGINLGRAELYKADLTGANLAEGSLGGANLGGANLTKAYLPAANLYRTSLVRANLTRAVLDMADLNSAVLYSANLDGANLIGARFQRNLLWDCNFAKARVKDTAFGKLDLRMTVGLEDILHRGPSSISTDTFVASQGQISEVFLRGCGLSDWEIEQVKLYNPELSNDERNKILYKIYDLQASQAIQVSPLFISYSHSDGMFVDKLESQLNKKGIRFWRDIRDMKAGRIERQIDKAISQNPTVLLVLSEHSLSSDWVEHEVRAARDLEKEMGRDALCPVALDDSWKSSPWPKRVTEQIMEYNILDFSAWKDDSKFDSMFRKLIDGLELFYKG